MFDIQIWDTFSFLPLHRKYYFKVWRLKGITARTVVEWGKDAGIDRRSMAHITFTDMCVIRKTWLLITWCNDIFANVASCAYSVVAVRGKLGSRTSVHFTAVICVCFVHDMSCTVCSLFCMAARRMRASVLCRNSSTRHWDWVPHTTYAQSRTNDVDWFL